jgi:hypothetical protein
MRLDAFSPGRLQHNRIVMRPYSVVLTSAAPASLTIHAQEVCVERRGRVTVARSCIQRYQLDYLFVELPKEEVGP